MNNLMHVTIVATLRIDVTNDKVVKALVSSVDEAITNLVEEYDAFHYVYGHGFELDVKRTH